MHLFDYYEKQRKENRMTIAAMARELGVSRESLSVLLSGKRPPTYTFGMKVEKYTKGKVKWWEMVKYYQSKSSREERKSPSKKS